MKPILIEIEIEFGPYMNRHGFITAGGDVDHSPLFHGFYVALLDRLNLLDYKEKIRQQRLLKTLIHPYYPGILLSAPFGSGPNSNEHSHDNVKAMLWMSKRLGMSFAADFLEHGRRHNWNWNADDPEKFDSSGSYGRFGDMIGQAMLAAGEDPPEFYRAWLYAKILYGSMQRKGRVERVTLPYFQCKTMRGEGSIANLLIDRWRNKKMEMYPGGIGEVFDKWGGPWKGHPYVKWYQGIIDV